MIWLMLFTACSDITRIEDGATLGDVVVLKDLFTSIQLLEDGDRIVLFDGGYRARVIEKHLEARGHSLADVTDVFLTHGHPDHLNVISSLPSATVYAFAQEAALIAEESEGAVTIDHELVSGEVIALADATVEAFWIPGHTAGSAAYLTSGGALILGDALYNARSGEPRINDGRHTEDPDQLLESLRALADTLEPREEQVQWLVPAHSAALSGLAPLGRL